MTALQPGVDVQYACVSVSFPFKSMIEAITTWIFCSSLWVLNVPSFQVSWSWKYLSYPCSSTGFVKFLLFAMGCRLWTVPDLIKDSFTFPHISPDAACSSHLLPHLFLLAEQLDQSTPPAAEGIPNSYLREEHLVHPEAQDPLITSPLGSPS